MGITQKATEEPQSDRGDWNVRFGSKADMAAHFPDVRFTPKSRH